MCRVRDESVGFKAFRWRRGSVSVGAELPGIGVGRRVVLRRQGEFRVRIVSGGVTDLGRVRTNNEDCYKIVEPLNLFVLSDGMGGEAHGEIASAMAVETVAKHCLDMEGNPAAEVIAEVQPNWSPRTKPLSPPLPPPNRTTLKP